VSAQAGTVPRRGIRLDSRLRATTRSDAKLHLAETTVRSHVQSMLGKLGVRDRLQAAVAAYDAGLVRPYGS
jgi:DNA-binding CsgD family transcriptional regulator